MTSPSLMVYLAMTPTIPSCSHATRSRPLATTLTSIATTALDALYRQEQATADPGARQQIFRLIHQIYLTEFPFIVLFSPTRHLDRAQGDAQLPAQSAFVGDTVNIWEWWCDKGKC